MPYYIKQGRNPKYRHMVFQDDKGNHYYEEHMSRLGFSDIYSNVYHIHMPTEVAGVGNFHPINLQPKDDDKHRHHHFQTFKFGPRGDFVNGRRYLMYNNDVVLSTCSPTDNADYFFKNAICDEIMFIHRGEGRVDSMFGQLEFHQGDYVVIPRGVIYQLTFHTDDNRMFIVESHGPVDTPKHFRNQYGQLLEDAPYCERDIRIPDFQEPIDKKGKFPVHIRLKDGIQEYQLGHHPFDLIGYDGFYYPWIFNINDYMPKVGRVHLPPPSHLTFTGRGYVLCSFCPRPFDFGENTVPIPYAHSNLDSDEVIYYAEGNFMSRKGIELGSVTLHPYGIPHGPQPGLLEKSIGAKETKELAVMVDTFAPLHVVKESLEVDDPTYPFSWQT